VNVNGNGKRLTNRELAEIDQVFRRACEAAGVWPSRTRYRRYKTGRGYLWDIAHKQEIDKSGVPHIGDK